MDRVIGHADGQGPTTRKLAQFPPVLDLVFGAWAESSEGVNRLITNMVDSKLRSLG